MITNFMSRKVVIISTFVLLLLLLATIPSFYFYNQYKTAQQKLQNPSEYTKEEVRLLVEKVGKLIELPPDEEPTIATVTDADRLRSQPFFENSMNGDRVLIFTNAKKAYLYRPSSNKVIEVAPVNIGDTASPSAQVQPMPTLTQTQLIEPIPPTDIVSPTPAF